MLGTILEITQLILGVLLIVVVLLQQKGSGLGAAFGGGGGGVQSTRRGVDRILHRITIAVSIIFFILAVANLLV